MVVLLEYKRVTPIALDFLYSFHLFNLGYELGLLQIETFIDIPVFHYSRSVIPQSPVRTCVISIY